MEEKLLRKQLRRRINPAGWSMLAYYGLMNAAVMVVMILDAAIYLLSNLDSWSMEGLNQRLLEFATGNGWGYLLAAAIGGVIALAWKKMPFWHHAVFAKEKPMTAGAFLQILCVFISVQSVLQLAVPMMEWFFNLFGLSVTAAMESASMATTGFSMFLYAAILGPIAEELLCRGLVLRLLRPFGKQLAVFGSALLFGLMHGNVIQIPFAFLIGLVLGYVTVEYSIWWAMVLHIINNFVLSDLIGRLPVEVGNLLLVVILFVALVAAVLILLIRKDDVKAYFRENRMEAQPVKAFFTSPGILTFSILMLLMSLLSFTRI